MKHTTMAKRALAFGLSAAMALSLAGCGGSGSSGGDQTIRVGIWDNN